MPPQTPTRVLFQDEGRFGRISNHRRCWGPLPKRPAVGQQVIRQFIYTLLVVSPHDGKISSLIAPWVDAEIMSIFLNLIAKEFPDDFCLIFLDGAGWHRANNLRVPKSMKLIFLPPYRPELNPVESLWDHLRENYFSNRVFDSLDQIEDTLCKAIRNLIDNPDTVHSITSYPWIQYYMYDV